MTKQGESVGANLDEGFAWAEPCGHVWRIVTIYAFQPCPVCADLKAQYDKGRRDGLGEDSDHRKEILDTLRKGLINSGVPFHKSANPEKWHLYQDVLGELFKILNHLLEAK